MKAEGHFTSDPRRKFIDARVWIDDEEFDAVIPLSAIHKQQRHLATRGVMFSIGLTGKVRLHTKKWTAAEIMEAHKKAQEYALLFEGVYGDPPKQPTS